MVRVTDMKASDRIVFVLNLIAQYGSIDGAHHKQWVLDQVARALQTPQEYQEWAESLKFDDNGQEIYSAWDTGIAP